MISEEEVAQIKQRAEEQYGMPFDQIDWNKVHQEISEQIVVLREWAQLELAHAPLGPCACGSSEVIINPIPAFLEVIIFCGDCQKFRTVYHMGES